MSSSQSGQGSHQGSHQGSRDATSGDQDTSSSEPLGDPERGYDVLVNTGYVSCGIPEGLSSLINLGDEGDRIPGRDAENSDLPYYLTRHQSASGVSLFVNNCLSCHASRVNGQLIVGLGDIYQDYSQDLSSLGELAITLSDRLLETEAERAELTKFTSRSLAIAPYARTLTRGVNPAMSITAGIMTHLDPETLVWSDEPLLDVPESYGGDVVVASNPPPWWWYKKKSRMFYSASGGGSHVAWSMLASSLCLDDRAQAEQLAADFPDLLAYLKTIEAPEYPWEVDEDLAREGEAHFNEQCARCHGTYGLEWTYPDLVIPLEEVGVDPDMARYMFDAELFHDWVARSFFGERSVATPELGYVAPPLDGVWATAPYLHNGSVPTIAGLLDSSRRPQCWTWSYDSTDYDPISLGWNYQEAPCHAELSADERGVVYDTTQVSYGNQGHTYGDQLSERERLAIIEYLKTL